MYRNKGFGKKHPSSKEKKDIVKLYRSGSSIEVLSEIFGFHSMTIYRWVRERKSNKSFKRKSTPGSGRNCHIEGVSGKKLIELLKHSATQYGFETPLWDTRRIEILCKRELGLIVSRMAVWRFLNKMDYTCKRVQKTYMEANPKKQKEWVTKTISEIKETVKIHRAILYFEDETNISLSPVMGASWSPRGQSITARVTGRRGSVSAISVISNDGRLIFSLHDSGKRFRSDDIINFLGHMLSHHSRRHLVVVMDQAPCHMSKKVKKYIEAQKRLHVFYLPPYSPDFNPDEKVWNHLKNIELKNHQKQNYKELKRLVRSKLKKMSKSPETLFAIFNRCSFSYLYQF